MNLNEYCACDGTELAGFVKRQEVDPLTLASLSIEAANAINPKLNAVIDLYQDRATKLADGIDLDGPFAGVPLLLKDTGTTEAGRPQACGSHLGSSYIAADDSFLTQKIVQAGFNIIGRSNMPELAQAATSENRYFGTARNPWDLERTPAGSSSGAAAAVAAGIVPVAHGTDTGGSIRAPAACCGLVGLKPSRGRITKGPALDETLYAGLNTEFVLTKSIRDTASALDCLSGPGIGDPFSLPKNQQSYSETRFETPNKLRIALQLGLDGVIVDEAVKKVAQQTAEELERQGHYVELSSPNLNFEHWATAERTIWTQSTAMEIARISRETGNPVDEKHIEPLSYAAYLEAQKLTINDWFLAMQYCNSICRDTGKFFEKFDVLVTPTVAQVAPYLGVISSSSMDDYGAFMQGTGAFCPFTSLFNITGQPAISLPLGVSPEGLPIGVQLVGRVAEEKLLLQLASHFERAMPWGNRRPPVHAGG